MRRDLLHTYRNPYFFVITKPSRIGFARILAGGGGGNGQIPYGVGGITTIISTQLPVSFFFLRMRLSVIQLHGAAATNPRFLGTDWSGQRESPTVVRAWWQDVLALWQDVVRRLLRSSTQTGCWGAKAPASCGMLFDVHAPGSHLVEVDHHWAPCRCLHLSVHDDIKIILNYLQYILLFYLCSWYEVHRRIHGRIKLWFFFLLAMLCHIFFWHQ